MLERLKKDFSKTERGASMFEVILAMAIVGMIAPFAYQKIFETTRDLSDIGIARYIQGYEEPILNYIRVKQVSWPATVQKVIPSESFYEELKPFGADPENQRFKNFIDGKSVLINKSTTGRGNMVVNAYMIVDMDKSINMFRAHHIASVLGMAGGAVEADGNIYSILGSWSITDWKGEDNVVAYRIDATNKLVQNNQYLHRLKLGSRTALNSMETTLYLGEGLKKHDLNNVRDLFGNILNVGTNISSYFINAEELKANEGFFFQGAKIIPINDQSSDQKTSMQSMRVTEEIMGAKEIQVPKFFGGLSNQEVGDLENQNYHQQGKIVANRTAVSKELWVGELLEAKSDSTRTLSFFNKIVARTMSVPYVKTTTLTFAGDFGLAISNEILREGEYTPIKFGYWSYSLNPAQNNYKGPTPPSFAKLTLLGLTSFSYTVDNYILIQLGRNGTPLILEKEWYKLKTKGGIDLEEGEEEGEEGGEG